MVSAGAGVLCAAAMMSTAGKVLSEKLDVAQLTFYTAPISCTILLPFFVSQEVCACQLCHPIARFSCFNTVARLPPTLCK